MSALLEERVRPRCREACGRLLQRFCSARAGPAPGTPEFLLQDLPERSRRLTSQRFAAAVVRVASCSCVSRVDCLAAAWRDPGSLLGP